MFGLTPKKKRKARYHFLRWVTNIWTLFLFYLIVLDFVYDNQYITLVEPAAVLYIGTLALYSVEKEFERWYEYHIGRHPGEMYVIVWTALLLGIVIAQLFMHKHYHLPSEVVATYIGVLGMLAITKKSKEFYRELRNKDSAED